MQFSDLSQKFYFSTLFLAAFCLCFFVMSFSASAADPKEDKLEELEKLKEQEEKYRKLIELKEREEESIQGEVNNLESKSQDIEDDITKRTQEILILLSEVEAIKEQIRQKDQTIESQKILLAGMIRSNYEELKNRDQIGTILPQNAKQLTASSSHVQITEKLTELTDIIITEKTILGENQKSLKEKQREVEKIRAELEQKNVAIEKVKTQKEFDAIETLAEQKKFEERLDDVLEKQLEIQQEIDSLSTSYIGTFSLKDLPSKKDASFSRPVKGKYEVTQGYGKTSFSHHYQGGNHNGVDYSGRFNKIILSTGSGTVYGTGNMGRYGYGKWIAIDHKNGLISLYGHLSEVSVKKNDKVSEKDQIGIMGNTGFSTAAHLHFSLFVKSTFRIVNSSSVSGIKIPSGATINPALYY